MSNYIKIGEGKVAKITDDMKTIRVSFMSEVTLSQVEVKELLNAQNNGDHFNPYHLQGKDMKISELMMTAYTVIKTVDQGKS